MKEGRRRRSRKTVGSLKPNTRPRHRPSPPPSSDQSHRYKRIHTGGFSHGTQRGERQARARQRDVRERERDREREKKREEHFSLSRGATVALVSKGRSNRGAIVLAPSHPFLMRTAEGGGGR